MHIHAYINTCTTFSNEDVLMGTDMERSSIKNNQNNTNNMMQEQNCGEGECGEHNECGCHMPKEFKIAKLEKKEKMLQAELEFIGKIKELIKKMPEENK